MGNLNPLKYCFCGKHSKPRATFRMFPGVENTSEVCADCFEKIMAERKEKGEGGSASYPPQKVRRQRKLRYRPGQAGSG